MVRIPANSFNSLNNNEWINTYTYRNKKNKWFPACSWSQRLTFVSVCKDHISLKLQHLLYDSMGEIHSYLYLNVTKITARIDSKVRSCDPKVRVISHDVLVLRGTRVLTFKHQCLPPIFAWIAYGGVVQRGTGYSHTSTTAHHQSLHG